MTCDRGRGMKEDRAVSGCTLSARLARREWRENRKWMIWGKKELSVKDTCYWQQHLLLTRAARQKTRGNISTRNPCHVPMKKKRSESNNRPDQRWLGHTVSSIKHWYIANVICHPKWQHVTKFVYKKKKKGKKVLTLHARKPGVCLHNLGKRRHMIQSSGFLL